MCRPSTARPCGPLPAPMKFLVHAGPVQARLPDREDNAVGPVDVRNRKRRANRRPRPHDQPTQASHHHRHSPTPAAARRPSPQPTQKAHRTYLQSSRPRPRATEHRCRLPTALKHQSPHQGQHGHHAANHVAANPACSLLLIPHRLALSSTRISRASIAALLLQQPHGQSQSHFRFG